MLDNVNGTKVPRYLIYDIVVYEVCGMDSIEGIIWFLNFRMKMWEKNRLKNVWI